MRLQLTRRADYAVRAMIALGRDPARVQSSTRLAESMDIPPRFMTQVMGDLVRAGLVEARNGRAGGYRLKPDPTQVSVLAVVQAVEGDARRRTCVLRSTRCSVGGLCDVHELFTDAQDALLARLAGASLSTVLAGVHEGRDGAEWSERQ
jgi:Rrf2 family protein